MTLRDTRLSAVLASTTDSVTLDHTTAVYLDAAEFAAESRVLITPRASQHGARHAGPAKRSGGVWSAEIRVRGDRTTLDQNRSSVESVVSELVNGDGSLTWTQGGSQRSLSGLVLLGEAWKADGSSMVCSLQVSSERPFAEDTTAVVSDSAALTVGGGGFAVPLTIPFTLTASTGGDLALNHVGDFVEAYPLLRVYGPIVNPHVINHTVEKRLVFDASIADGEYWDIDPFALTVTSSTGARVRALVPLESTWWALRRGVNNLQLAGSGYSASTKLRAYMKNTWG